MSKKIIHAALLGLGTVGTGVYKVLKSQEEEMEQKIGAAVAIKKILVRNLKKAAAKLQEPELLTDSWQEILEDESIDIIIEVMGGIHPPEFPASCLSAVPAPAVAIKKILVRNLKKAAAKLQEPELLTDSWQEILEDESIDIIIEVMGGIHPAKEYITAALRAGKHVVTANKDLVASFGGELLDCAAEHHCDFLFEASVAGGIPIIRPLKQCLAGNHISEVVGIVNGTTNFILTKMTQEHMEFADAFPS